MLSVRDRRFHACFLELYEYEASMLKASADPALSLACFNKDSECCLRPTKNCLKEIAAHCFHRFRAWDGKRGNCIRKSSFYSHLTTISTRMILVADTVIVRSTHKVRFSSWTHVLRTSRYA
jgi:hypothetical protein